MGAELKQATLVFPRTHEGKIILAMKKRGFGEGRWNGMGGKVEDSESIEEAAARELEEEIGITVATSSLIRIANLKFYFPKGKEEFNQEVNVFEVGSWTGAPTESDEMRPEEFEIDDKT